MNALIAIYEFLHDFFLTQDALFEYGSFGLFGSIFGGSKRRRAKRRYRRAVAEAKAAQEKALAEHKKQQEHANRTSILFSRLGSQRQLDKEVGAAVGENTAAKARREDTIRKRRRRPTRELFNSLFE